MTMTDWFYLLPLVLGFCSEIGLAETHRNSYHPRNWMKNLSASNQNDDDSPMNDYASNSRKYFWEPMADGKVIGSIGNLFSDKTRKEANRERLERENLRNEMLTQKYITMMNDPEGLAELEQESTNSPSKIDQQVRRSSSQRFNQPIQKNYVPRKQLHRKPFNSGGRSRVSRGQGKNSPQIDSILLTIILRKSDGPGCGLQSLQSLDYLEGRIQKLSPKCRAPTIYINTAVQNYGSQNDDDVQEYLPNPPVRSLFPLHSILVIPHKVTDLAENMTRNANYKMTGRK